MNRNIFSHQSYLPIQLSQYTLPDGREVAITLEGNVLKLPGKDSITASLYPETESKLFTHKYDLHVEFMKNGTGKISNFSIYNEGKQLMDVKRTE